VLSTWDLLRDVVGQAPVRQGTPWVAAADVLASAPAGDVIVLGPMEPWRQAVARAGRPVVSVGWPTTLHPDAHGEIRARRGRIPTSSKAGAVLISEALEECDDPVALVQAVRRVCAPGAVLCGVTSSIEPQIVARMRSLAPVGLRILLEDHGFAVDTILPGPDADAVAEHRRGGGNGWPLPDGMSAGNRALEQWGKESGRRPGAVLHRMLQFAGLYVWTARVAGRGPTQWSRDLRSGRLVALRDAAKAQDVSRRTFVLTMPPEAQPRELEVQADASGFSAARVSETGVSGYEPESIAAMLAASDLAGPGAVYDVGANIGVFSLVAAASTPRGVVAFEPMPGLAATLRDAASRNGLVELRVEEVALSDRSGTATFYASAVTDLSNSLNPWHRAPADSFAVAVDTLDAFVDRTGLSPAVIKIDTETTEPDVLMGARRTIERLRPWILCEVLDVGRPEEVAAAMADLGYHYYRITDAERWRPADVPTPDPQQEFLNWLFAPVPLDEAYWIRYRAWRAALNACDARTL
jgi:FkbM family methyltransferase